MALGRGELIAVAFLPAIASGIARGQLERRRRAVDAQHLARAAVQSAHSPCSDVAEYIQHSRALADVFYEGAAICRLVEEPSGLLTLRQGSPEFQSVFDDLRQVVYFSPGGLDVAREALHFARGAVVLEKQRLAMQNLAQGILNLRFEPFHAGGPDLHDAGRPVAVDNQARQA